MGKIKFSIHPSFLLFAIILIYFKKGELLLTYVFVLIIHELSHAIVAKKLGYSINNIRLIPFGICLNINSKEIRPIDEIKIAVAGPLVNLLISFGLVCIWWFLPSIYNHTNLFCYANLITCLFNLIPAFPLDGGRVLFSVLKENFSLQKSIKICKIINVFVIVVLFALFIISCFFQTNFTYLLVMVCVFSGLINNKTQVYSLINFSLQKKVGKILKVKNVCVSVDEKIFKVCKYIDSFSYIKIFLYEEKNKVIVKELFESDFLKLIEQNYSNLSFREVLNLY